MSSCVSRMRSQPERRPMPNLAILDTLPIWLVFLLTAGMIVLWVEIGFRIGVARARRSAPEREAPIDSMVGSTLGLLALDRKSTRLNSSHSQISYAVFCLKKKSYISGRS